MHEALFPKIKTLWPIQQTFEENQHRCY